MELTSARCVMAFASLWIAQGLFGLLARSDASRRRESTLVLVWGLLTATSVSLRFHPAESILPLVIVGVIGAGLISTRRLLANSNPETTAETTRGFPRDPETAQGALATSTSPTLPNSAPARASPVGSFSASSTSSRKGHSRSSVR